MKVKPDIERKQEQTGARCLLIEQEQAKKTPLFRATAHRQKTKEMLRSRSLGGKRQKSSPPRMSKITDMTELLLELEFPVLPIDQVGAPYSSRSFPSRTLVLPSPLWHSCLTGAPSGGADPRRGKTRRPSSRKKQVYCPFIAQPGGGVGAGSDAPDCEHVAADGWWWLRGGFLLGWFAALLLERFIDCSLLGQIGPPTGGHRTV